MRPYVSTLSICFRPENGACLRLGDIPFDILGQEETPFCEVPGRCGYSVHVAVVTTVALLERQARVAGRQPFRLGGLEGDVLPRRFTPVVLAEAGTAQRPTGRGSRRRRDRRQADTGDL